MRMQITSALLLLWPAALAAQTITTAPAGFETTTGSQGVQYPWSFGTSAQFRYQEVHTSLVGTPLLGIRAANFRRDETAATVSTAAPRTMNVEFRMGHGLIETFACKFGENYVAPHSVVFMRRPVNLPDWINRQGSGGAEPWSVRLPYDTPWNYNGSDDLVWEVIWDGASLTGSRTADRAGGTGTLFSTSIGTAIGAGCIATGRTASFVLSTQGLTHVSRQLMRLRTFGTNAPDNAPVTMFIDSVNSNLSIPGVCTNLYALPTLQLPIGVAAVGGSLPQQDLHLPYLPILHTVPNYMQAVALDPGQSGLPVVLSQGRTQTWPQPTGTQASMAYAYSVDISGNTLASGPFIAGSAICGLER